MSLRHLTFGLTVAAALVGSGLAAGAADLDDNYGYADQLPAAPTVIPEAKVEFGSGWYVRGDVGATRLPAMGLESSINSAPTVSLQQGSQYGYDASLGAGYEINRWFRADAIFDFHKPVSVSAYGFPAKAGPDPQYGNYQNTSGTCQLGFVSPVAGEYYPSFADCHTQYEGRIQSYDVLANGYINLGNYGIASPYIGAGAGLSFGHYQSSISYYLEDGSRYNTTYNLPGSTVQVHGYKDVRVSSTFYNFAFAAMAGVSLDVYAHTKLDIGYRYLNLGQVLGTTLQYHEVRAGLRYMIDN